MEFSILLGESGGLSKCIVNRDTWDYSMACRG